jgi:vesicle coat complex subunit
MVITLINQCNSSDPLSAATLVPIFLAGCRDPDPLVRASALSNLAELCELLHYALLPFLEEIVSCVQSLLQSDTTVEVRRGECQVDCNPSQRLTRVTCQVSSICTRSC